MTRFDAARLSRQPDQIANEAQTDIETRSKRALRSFATAVGFTDFGPYVEGVRSHHLLSCWTYLKQFWFTQICDIDLRNRDPISESLSENLKIHELWQCAPGESAVGRKSGSTYGKLLSCGKRCVKVILVFRSSIPGAPGD